MMLVGLRFHLFGEEEAQKVSSHYDDDLGLTIHTRTHF